MKNIMFLASFRVKDEYFIVLIYFQKLIRYNVFDALTLLPQNDLV